MKGIFVTALAWLGLFLSPARSAENCIYFLNGDCIAGSLAAMGRDEMILDSPLLHEPASFLTNQVYSLRLPSIPPERVDSNHEAEVTLTNGDVLHGQLAEVSGDHLLLDTWYAGRLSLNRRMVESVTVADIGKMLYRGPTGMDGWRVHPEGETWIYDSFSFSANGAGSLSRDSILAGESSVAFALRWDAADLRCSVVLFSDLADSLMPSVGYRVQFHGYSVSIRSLASNEAIGNVFLNELRNVREAEIEIRASRLTGKMVLLVDGRIKGVWQDNQLKQSRLKGGLHFLSESGSKIRLSNLRIEEWDGEGEENPLQAMQMGMQPWAQGRNANPEDDFREREENGGVEPRMKLANGDSITGKVKSIRNGVVRIDTPLGPVSIPVRRLRSVLLPAAPREEPLRRNHDIRCKMADGGSVVFEMISADEKTITGSSQNFGSAVFLRDAFQRIDFNIHMPEYGMMRKRGEDWEE